MTASSPRTPRFARFLPAVAVLMIGCAWLAAAATHGDREEAFDLGGESFTRTFEYPVTAGTVALEIELEASVTAGSLHGRVLDPAGKERLALHLDRGSGRGTTGRVEALAGTWRLEVRADGARGRALARYASR